MFAVLVVIIAVVRIPLPADSLARRHASSSLLAVAPSWEDRSSELSHGVRLGSLLLSNPVELLSTGLEPWQGGALPVSAMKN